MSNEMPDLTPVFNNTEKEEEIKQHTITIKVTTKYDIAFLKAGIEDLLKSFKELKAIESYELD